MLPILGSLLITGFLGSLGHCLGMCGPLVIIMGNTLSAEPSQKTARQFLYHASRITVYMLLGGIAGFTGSFLKLGSKINLLTGIVSILLGIAIVFLGFINLGLVSPHWLQGKSTWVARAMGTAIREGGIRGVLALGALNGLLPCGLVYSAVLVAASTASLGFGILAMLVFGMATLPVMLLLGLGSASLRVQNRLVWFRLAAVFIIFVGIQQMARGLSTLHVIPPLVLGGVVIW